MGPLYCPRCRRPWYACNCRRKYEELPEKIDCSFICMPAFLNFDKNKPNKNNGSCINNDSTPYSTSNASFRDIIHQPHQPEPDIFDEIVSSGSTTVLCDSNKDVENRDPNIPDDNDDFRDDLVEGVDEEFLNGFLDEKKESVVYNHEMENKRNFIRRKLDFCKKFYFDANDQLLLNHRSFLKYSGITTFEVGYAWKNRVDKMDKIELLCQLVNEVNQIKACCLQLYYRESAVSVSKGRREKLVKKYIGIGHEKDFNESVEREVKEFVWFLKTYKKRYLDVKDRVMKVLGLDEEFLKSIKTFEDVYDYFIYHLDKKNGQFNVV